jgi:Rod binding domain-containing protein
MTIPDSVANPGFPSALLNRRLPSTAHAAGREVKSENTRKPEVRNPEARKIEKAALQFETQLLTSILTALEKSIGAEDTGAGEQYKTMATQGLASAWAAAGGIGIAHMISQALSHTPQSGQPQVPKAVVLPPLPSSYY